jgi:NAD+ kinase
VARKAGNDLQLSIVSFAPLCFAVPVRMKRIAFVYNGEKPAAAAFSLELARRARAAGVRVKRTEKWPLPGGYLRGMDACCVIGGDGTLLGVVQEAARTQVPVIGVNLGSLGFLTNFTTDDARSTFDEILHGKFSVSPRSLLSCQVDSRSPRLALNDVVIKERGNVRMLRLEVFADDEPVTEFHCDGLIVSSPTGSTAYNLSAGGPILHPGAAVIAVTPICPHTLSNRTIIFKDEVRLRVVNRTPGARLQLALDGHRNLVVAHAQPITLSRAGVTLPLAQKLGYSHFEVVRTKLQWSGSHVRPVRIANPG